VQQKTLLHSIQIVLATFLLSATAIAQTVQSNYPSGAVKEIGEKNPKGKQGRWVYFSEKGDTLETKTYHNGVLNGPFAFYYSSGKKMRTGSWRNALEHGVWHHYTETDSLYLIDTWSNGKLNGNYRGYHPAGNISVQGTYQDGKREGEWMQFGVANDTLAVNYYTLGEMDGWQKKYARGRLLEKVYIQEGKRNGKLFQYNYMGYLDFERTYKDSELHGVEYTYWYGQLSAENHYYEGKLHGQCLTYSNGDTLSERNFQHGLMYGDYIIYSATTKKVTQEGSYRNNIMDGQWNSYAADGSLVERKHYVLGQLQGEYAYYSSGMLSQYGFYHNGLRTGKWTWYYTTTGQVNAVRTFSNNTLDGESIVYHPNRKMSERGYFSGGLKEGKWLYYDSEGKLIREEKYSRGKLKQSIAH